MLAPLRLIADWPHLPKQAEVQEKIDGAHNEYVTFLLCTPTSIMPAVGNGDSVTKDRSHGSRRRG